MASVRDRALARNFINKFGFFVLWTFWAVISMNDIQFKVGDTFDVRWIDPPPPQTLPLDQITMPYVLCEVICFLLNNENKPQIDGLVRRPNRWGGGGLVNPVKMS